MSKATAYWDYIKVEELLALQRGLEPTDAGLSNDEVMFITVHQIDELWFKLVLREMVAVRNLFAAPRVAEQSLAAVVRGIRRMELLLHHTAQHFAVMETMTTHDYLAFRDKLNPASGFQSAGLREIEILAGLPDDERLPLGSERNYKQALETSDGQKSPALARVEARLRDTPSLRDAIEEWLHRTPIDGSAPGDAGDDAAVQAFLTAYTETHARATDRTFASAREVAFTKDDVARLEQRYAREKESARAFLFAEDVPEARRTRVRRVRAALMFIESYRELPLLAWPREVIEAIVAFEQAFVIFRQRHARMVERIIGRRTGTGGSAGVDYLDGTALKYRIFRDVWAVRTLLVPKSDLPPLRAASMYGFAAGE